MRYTIGCRMISKNGTSDYNGVYALGFLGLSFVLQKENYKHDSRDIPLIMVFDDLDSAILEARILSRSYRRDDVSYKKYKSRVIRRFYPLKVDSANFPFLLDEKDKSAKKGYIRRNEYNEKVCDNGTWLGEFKYIPVVGLKETNLYESSPDCSEVV